MALPNFICVGAERAGTTALWHVLRQHPDVLMPESKETHFFTRHYGEESLIFYEGRIFREYRGQRAIGEATPEYMRFPEVPARLREALGPGLKLIFCLRDPVKRAFSQYILRCRLAEENESFERAVQLEHERMRENRYLGVRRAYVGGSLYSEQIERFLKVFPIENMFFQILEEDFMRNRARTVAQLCEFIGVSAEAPLNLDVPDTSHRAPRVNFIPAGQTRVMLAQDTGRKITVRGEAIVFLPDNPAAQRVIFRPSENAKTFFRKLAANQTEELPATFAAELYERYFREEITRMETLLGRDLSCWRRQWEEESAARATGSATGPR